MTVDNFQIIRTFILETGQEKGTVSGQMVLAALNDLEKELEATERLLKDSNTVLQAVPACKIHGDTCIPHAIEWIERIKTLGKVIYGDML